MASHKRPSLSILERIDLLFIRTPLFVTYVVLGTLVTHPFRRKLGWVWKRTLALVFVRAIFRFLSPRMIRARSPTTGQIIAQVCSEQHLSYQSKPLDCGAAFPAATLHRIQLSETVPKDNRRVFFYLHGGGYCAPISQGGQLPVWLDLARAARATHLAIVEYTLAPELKYPGQLAQASAALAALLADRAPADLVLGADSAGGNLALALLAHLKAPHPDARIPPVDLAGGVFAGVLLASPWVAMTVTAPSYAAFDGVDMILPSKMEEYVARFAPPRQPRLVYADPVVERGGFWRSVPAARVLITAGTHECFIDDIRDMADLMGAQPYTLESGKDVTVGLAVGKNEVHVQMAINKSVGLGTCETLRIALQWMETL